MTRPDLCPRCESAAVSTLAHSPISGAWTMFGCGICFYAWRSTEPAAATDPEQYPLGFKIDPASIDRAPRIV